VLAMPLFDRSEVVGALVALARDARPSDRDALSFFQSVAHLLAAAIQRSRVEEQLSHAQRLDAVGQLTGGVAHDFNNLLTVISGNLQLLQDEMGDKPDAQEIIAAALGAVTRGAELTRKLLAFARKQRLSPQDVDPERLLGELGGMLRRTLGETMQLEVICAPGIAHVYADLSQLEAALINLALNARDAMPRGGHLSLQAEHALVVPDEATPELPAGDYIAFSVRDTGFGMTPETLARAFEPFFTTKETGKGSGLGLSMVYGFVKQSQGHLAVESRLGYGTCMRIYLPMSMQPAKASAEKARASPGNETVLVVEDENDVRRIAERFLAALGYRVLCAPDGETAMQRLKADASIALLFSDVVLGTGMNGAELAAEAQRLKPGLRVLLASGYEYADGQGSGPALAYPLLQKPYRREDLAEAVRRVLDGG
jgi:signal transduction histidine kinase/CheY-like chemotaxis protein